MAFKEGDVVLRTAKSYNCFMKTGNIYKVISRKGVGIDVKNAKGEEQDGWIEHNFREATPLEINAFNEGCATLEDYQNCPMAPKFPKEGWVVCNSLDEADHLVMELEKGKIKMHSSSDSIHMSIAWDEKNYWNISGKSGKPKLNFGDLFPQYTKNYINFTNKTDNDIKTTTIERQGCLGGRIIRFPSGRGQITSAKRLVGNKARGKKIRGRIIEGQLNYSIFTG